MRPGSNESVIVTGASQGIGFATAVRLAAAGFHVWAGYRESGDGARLTEVARDRGLALEAVELDVTDQVSVERAVDRIVAQSGAPYALVSNAGIVIRGYFEDLSEDEIRRMFEVNLFGAMRVSRCLLPHLRAAGRGRIVMMSSIAGRIGSVALTGYVATKFALEGFAESLALEVAPLGIRVAIIEPGIVDTAIWDRSRRTAAAAQNPDGPYYRWFCRAEDMADSFVRSSPIKASDVADTVLCALTARQPRLRYLVGRRAGMVVALRRYLPGELFERIYFGEQLRRITRRAAS